MITTFRYLALTLLVGCGSTPSTPDLEVLYERAARYEDFARNPVVVIPGVLGSRLVDSESGRVVWGAFTGDFADPGTAAGARLVALPMQPGVELAELIDGVQPDGALESLDLRVFGLPIQLEAYRSILRTLGAGGYLDESLLTGGPAGEAAYDGNLDWGDEHFTCFQFDYDWRRSIPENAARLSVFLEARAADVRTERARRYGAAAADEPVKFDLVGHSLGGLIARWYLRFGDQGSGPEVPKVTWAGVKRVERCILVGTPSLGATQALSELVHGMDLGRFAADYPVAVLGTLPAVYQLLPHGPGTLIDAGRSAATTDAAAAIEPDVFDAALWRNLGWGLASPAAADQLAQLLPDVADPAERLAIALEHQTKCLEEARRVTSALDRPAKRPAGLDLILFAGDALQTPARAQYLMPGGDLWTASSAPGDGVVTRASALGDLRKEESWTPRLTSSVDWTRANFLFRDHLGLVNDPSFVDNLLYALLEEPRP